MCVKKICFLHVKMYYNFFHKVFAVHIETKLNQYLYKTQCHDFIENKKSRSMLICYLDIPIMVSLFSARTIIYIYQALIVVNQKQCMTNSVL